MDERDAMTASTYPGLRVDQAGTGGFQVLEGGIDVLFDMLRV